ncbi:MAG: branched-chain amino acid ABC transporter substrate-binding protein [Hyphomicrobiales bacterium]|nr:MAG: branched-chain amino acid ABC transporter substrate-binding protein [Hyphomicrobiales bacterium]
MKSLAAAFLIMLAAAPAAADALAIKVGVLRQEHSRETLSILDIPAADDTLAGALLGAADNNTTGKFTNQSYEAIDEKLDAGADAATAVDALVDKGARFIIADLNADRLLAASERARAKGALLFNVSAPDERLREEDCRANVIHVTPTRAMLADGLAQYLVWKQWRKWLLIKGSHPEDELLAQAYRRAAKKFGAKIVEERLYEDTGGGRRSDSGSVQTQRQMPVLTQNAPAYDSLVAIDESEVFAGYLPYRTWDPRPVAGSAGLYPTSWDPAHEQWGAHQLQNRFMATFRRLMNARDNNAWLAMRMIGEAATRANSGDPEKLRAFMASPEFSIAAFKGVRLTLRPWNQQLRQPILLSDGRMTVSVSPQEGFLHQVSELDTLGLDQPETKCRLK